MFYISFGATSAELLIAISTFLLYILRDRMPAFCTYDIISRIKMFIVNIIASVILAILEIIICIATGQLVIRSIIWFMIALVQIMIFSFYCYGNYKKYQTSVVIDEILKCDEYELKLADIYGNKAKYNELYKLYIHPLYKIRNIRHKIDIDELIYLFDSDVIDCKTKEFEQAIDKAVNEIKELDYETLEKMKRGYLW